jgi:hypothetical protein
MIGDLLGLQIVLLACTCLALKKLIIVKSQKAGKLKPKDSTGRNMKAVNLAV